MGNGFVSKQAFLPPPPQAPTVQVTDIERENPKDNPNLALSTSKLTIIQTQKYKHYIPVLEFRNKTSDIVLLYSHGNAEDLGGLEEGMKILHDNVGINVVAFDYSGYGLSTDSNKIAIESPSDLYCYDNIWAVYHYIKNCPFYTDCKIIVMGRSLGSGPATHLASRGLKRVPLVIGLILQSPLLSAVRVVMKTPVTLPIDIFPNVDKIGKIEVPIYIIHGKSDQVVNFEHGEALFGYIKNDVHSENYWIDQRGHNDIYYDEQYVNRMKGFIQKAKEAYQKREAEEKKKADEKRSSELKQSTREKRKNDERESTTS